MNILIVVSCILAVASASIYHEKIIWPHGVPVESPEHLAARAYHHAAHAEATAFHHNAAAHAAPFYDDRYRWAGKLFGLKVPIVHHARVEPINHWTGPEHIPIIGKDGVPVEPKENMELREFHEAAHAEAVARDEHVDAHVESSSEEEHGSTGYVYEAPSPVHGSYAPHVEPIHRWTGPIHIPVIGKDGVPIESKENLALREFHHAAHDEAVARNEHAELEHHHHVSEHEHGSGGYVYGVPTLPHGHVSVAHDRLSGYVYPIPVAAHGIYASHVEPIRRWVGPIHIPIIGKNGVPLEPRENVIRRAFHHAAHAEAAARSGYHGHGYDKSWAYAAHVVPVSWDADNKW